MKLAAYAGLAAVSIALAGCERPETWEVQRNEDAITDAVTASAQLNGRDPYVLTVGCWEGGNLLYILSSARVMPDGTNSGGTGFGQLTYRFNSLPPVTDETDIGGGWDQAARVGNSDTFIATLMETEGTLVVRLPTVDGIEDWTFDLPPLEETREAIQPVLTACGR